MLLAAHFQVLVEVASGMLEKIYLALYAIHLTIFFQYRTRSSQSLSYRIKQVGSEFSINVYHIENVDHSQIVSSTRRASSNSFKSKFNPNQMVPLSQLVRKCCNFAAEIYSDIAESSKMWNLFRYCRDPVETFTQLLKRFSHPLQCLRFTRYLRSPDIMKTNIYPVATERTMERKFQKWKAPVYQPTKSDMSSYHLQVTNCSK